MPDQNANSGAIRARAAGHWSSDAAALVRVVVDDSGFRIQLRTPAAGEPAADVLLWQVRRTVAEELCVNERRVTPQARFMEDLGATSIDIVGLLIALEEKFRIEFPFQDVDKIKTLAGVVALVRRLKAG